MDKQEVGTLGLSRRSVEQLERVIDTADTVLYPAHLMIGGWRMLFAAVLLAAYGVCYGIWWIGDSIYRVGVMHTVADAYHNAAALVSEFPYVSAIVVLVIGIPLCLVLLPVFRFFTELLIDSWLSYFSFVRRSRTGLMSAAEILTRGYDPGDFDFQIIDGTPYGKRRGT